MEKWGMFGVKNMVFIGKKARGGGGGFELVKAPEEKRGEMGGNGGKWGKVWEFLAGRWKIGEFWGRKGQKTWF